MAIKAVNSKTIYQQEAFNIFNDKQLMELLQKCMAHKNSRLIDETIENGSLESRFTSDEVSSLIQWSMFYGFTKLEEVMRKHPQFKNIEPMTGY